MKVPKPRKLKSGTWFLQLRLNGVSIPVTGRTEAECANNASLIKAEHKTGKRQISKDKTTVTLDKLLTDYITKYEKVLSPSTIRGYESIRKNRFPDYIGKPVKRIKWQEMINTELETKSEHTVKNGWGAITVAMRDAGIPVPPVKLAKVPVHELPYLTPDEIKLFLKAAEGDKAEIEMLLELHGLRESECMYVVRNNGINLKRHEINITGAVVPGKDHKFIEKETNKNYTSTRTVPIMIPRLEELVKYHQSNGIPIKTHSASALLSHVNKCCERAGVTQVGNHGLRRSFSTLCFSKGIPILQVQAWGGWKDYQTLYRHYIKIIDEDKAKNKKTVTDFFK